MIIGIDLGTTNSAVGIWRDGRAQLIPNSLGHLLTPSAVSLSDDDELIVGLAARERQVTNPDLTAVAFKRYMGSARTIKLGPESLYPEELSALVLRSLRADAEKFLGEPVTDAVITVPAYFNDRQRKATRRAARVAAQGREGGGSCDIKLPDDRNSISYSSDGSAPETFARVLRGAPG